MQFISKKLTPEETRYHTTDREALAVVRCLEECRWLVMQVASIPVILYTDHKALVSILQNAETSSIRIAGWQLRLGEYNLDIVHVKGTENGLADGLSRMPIRALDVGIVGKEQSYLSVITIAQDDSGRGFVLKVKVVSKGKKGSGREFVSKEKEGSGRECVSKEKDDSGRGFVLQGRGFVSEGRGENERTARKMVDSGKRMRKSLSDGDFQETDLNDGHVVEGPLSSEDNGAEQDKRGSGGSCVGKKMDPEELKERWHSWLVEGWYKEVVWFHLFGLTNEEKASSQLANRIWKKAANFRLVALHSTADSASHSTTNSASHSTQNPVRPRSLAFVEGTDICPGVFDPVR